jgi:hypothetical protein
VGECPPPKALLYNASAVHPLQRGAKQPFSAMLFLFQVLSEFLRKVLERKCPPLEGVSFELFTYSDFRGRI